MSIISCKNTKMSLKEKKKFLQLLKVMKKLKPNDRSELVPYLKAEALEFICECYHNVLFTDIGIKNKTKLKKRLKTECSVHRLKTISSKAKPLDIKIKALKHRGSGLGLILSVALPFLIDILSRKYMPKQNVQ